MKKVVMLCTSGMTALLVGCSAIPVNPQAMNVIVTPNPPPAGCKYVGQVTGNQGNFFTGQYTSNQNLAQGSLNDLKNKASALGANYVQIIGNDLGETGSYSGSYGGGAAETNMSNPGNAYNCPPALIGE